MNVKLVSITQPMITHEGLDQRLTVEQFIVYCARVSNPSNQLNIETAPKLIKYCIENRHWSIFEQAGFSVEIQTSRAIAAQILRHRSFAFQEFSQRYAVATQFESVELRQQARHNRQSSEDVIDDPDLARRVRDSIALAGEAYEHLLSHGVSKETARFVLPLTTSTTLFMNGSVRSWIHYLSLRCDLHSQKEHRLIAQEIRKIFCAQFPHTAEALGWEVQ